MSTPWIGPSAEDWERPEMKACPNCAEQVDVLLAICPHCQADLPDAPPAGDRSPVDRAIGSVLNALGTILWAFVIVVVAGLLFLFLLPGVGGGPAAPRTQCRNNLKQIGLALENYHDAYGSFPPAYVADKNGRPLYSWRVLILPYIDQSPLYNEFDLTQPWDSPTNLLILDTMPEGFRCPGDPEAVDNTTNYVAVFGPNCIFSGSRPTAIRDVTDELDNTIMIGEVTGRAIPWTKPEDIDIAIHPTIGIPGGFTSRHKGGCQFLFGNGRVKFLSEDISPKTLHDLFIKNDGHKVGAH